MPDTLQDTLKDSLYLPQPARILDVKPMTQWEKLFKLELPHGVSLGHEPGQFVELSVFGVGEAPISITSSPSRSNGSFELCVRRAGDMTNVLHRMQPGQVVGRARRSGAVSRSSACGARILCSRPAAWVWRRCVR
jgi:NAD(P)H-flavin reductase